MMPLPYDLRAAGHRRDRLMSCMDAWLSGSGLRLLAMEQILYRIKRLPPCAFTEVNKMLARAQGHDIKALLDARERPIKPPQLQIAEIR